MRFSDWSSDVGSSDLPVAGQRGPSPQPAGPRSRGTRRRRATRYRRPAPCAMGPRSRQTRHGVTGVTEPSNDKGPSNEARYRANFQDAVDGARLYHALAESEPNPDLAKVYARLADIAEAHADVWRKQPAALGQTRSEERRGGKKGGRT